MTYERIALGKKGEHQVSEWLQKKGYRIIAKNIRYKTAEIDMVAMHPDNSTVSFIEVRTRKTAKLGHPLETITRQKQANIRQAASLFLLQRKMHNIAIQFDVASIVWDDEEFTFLENAF